MSTIYQKRVVENVAHMGTSMSEWSATEIDGFEEAVNNKGRTVQMPTFNFPKNYKDADTLFKCPPTQPYCCELCGRTPINVIYYLQNDRAKLLLRVGSECVTHFQNGTSGDDNFKRFKLNSARVLDIELRSIRKHILDNHSRMVDAGYGRKNRQWDSCLLDTDIDSEYWNGLREGIKSLDLELVYCGRKGNTIYWEKIFKIIPVCMHDEDSKLLSWYTRNEQKATKLLREIKGVLELINDKKEKPKM